MKHSLHVAQSLGTLLGPSSPDSLTEHSLQVPQVAPQGVQVIAPAPVEWLSTGTLGKAAWLLRRELSRSKVSLIDKCGY